MRGGTLRHRVQVQKLDSTPDGSGEVTETYTTIWQGFASVDPIGAREFERNAQLVGTVSHIVKMRWTRGVVPGMSGRIMLGGRALNIVGVRDVQERRRELEIQCLEAAPV